MFADEDEEESEETKRRLAAYAAKKSTSELCRDQEQERSFSYVLVEVQIIAKSTIVLDVKPWDDETDIVAMEKAVRTIEADGLVWGPGSTQQWFVRLVNASL